MSRELISVRLDLIAAKATQLSNDYKGNRLWEGDLSRGLADIREQMNALTADVRTFDPSDR
jgi:hypothetical protein